MDVAADVEQFILRELLTGSAIDAIPVDEDLLASGIVDSHGVMQLVGFLQDRYGVTVRDDALTPENFQTIAAIAAFVERAKG
ncbi:MAG TPA: phosphopantetheine-binding protein [Conexibacter sp.]|nr:phosphopantetheine-binding protein [Conexibacter sp.]